MKIRFTQGNEEFAEMTKEEILKSIDTFEPIDGFNIMGASENWYNPYYAIKQTFSFDELNNMPEDELNHLVKLAENLSEAFY